MAMSDKKHYVNQTDFIKQLQIFKPIIRHYQA